VNYIWVGYVLHCRLYWQCDVVTLSSNPMGTDDLY
jgi:hypothetical protein